VGRLQDAVIADSIETLTRNLPRAIGRLVSSVLWTIAELPVDVPQRDSVSLKVIEPLPAWLPPRRTIGGFYVVRPLGTGGVSSVFIVKRIEERHEKSPELFALKVPEYSLTAARSVSESDFLTMFRDEASALLALPAHPNLARFVTFDAGAKPKPILVMELVEGTTLEKLIESRTLDVARAMRILDDVLAGLEAMHRVRVAHLDVKPSNVVLRNSGEAVLVDFGLAGRHIRPGCATGSYGAPEVWVTGAESSVRPMGADVYAFACTAFEALTGQVLFNAETELQLIARHLGHDGDPPIVRGLEHDPHLQPVASLLRACLRRDPGQRPSAGELRGILRQVAEQLAASQWPIQTGSAA
jgi:serine/threonine protein kinase